jgi:hypothetical protein
MAELGSPAGFFVSLRMTNGPETPQIQIFTGGRESAEIGRKEGIVAA